MEEVSFCETSVTSYHNIRGHDAAYRNTSVVTDKFISCLLPCKRRIKDSEVTIFETVKCQPFQRTVN